MEDFVNRVGKQQKTVISELFFSSYSFSLQRAYSTFNRVDHDLVFRKRMWLLRFKAHPGHQNMPFLS